MRKFVRNLSRKRRLMSAYIGSSVKSREYRNVFADVRYFCLFVGYPRSGHSLVGSLIDAHPNAVIAHEANAVKNVRYGFRRDQIFYVMMKNSEAFTANGRTYNGYKYLVPTQSPGRFEGELRVIGDKFGDFAIEAFARRKGLVEKVRQRVEVPLRFVHVIRNPFDNIATIYRWMRPGPPDLDRAIEYYFGLVESVELLKAQLHDDEMLDLSLEGLVGDPVAQIRRWCDFLGLDPRDDYVRDCAGVVFKAPKQTRREVEWTPGQIERIHHFADRHEYLRGMCDAF